MTANPGRLAQCDRPGCTAQYRIYRGEEARAALEAAGWTLMRPGTGQAHYDGDVFCPDHRPPREHVTQGVAFQDPPRA